MPEKRGWFTDRVPAFRFLGSHRDSFFLIISLAALGLSVVAITRTGNGTVSVVNGPRTSPVATSSDIVPPVAGESPTADGGGPGPAQEPDGLYPTTLPPATADYQKVETEKQLVLNPSESRSVDLDSVSVGTSSEISEFEYRMSLGATGPTLGFSTPQVAQAGGPDTTAGQCSELIRTAPIAQEVVPAKDQVLCVLTNGQGAVGEAPRTKIAIVTVQDVTKVGGVGISVSTWETP
ncbi:MAG: hypothetical protein QG608_248 [Actinomycetota bacterium]|nr:hypothetical protein [Actinomycetota bacterium]